MILSTTTAHLATDIKKANRNLPYIAKAGFKAVDFSLFSLYEGRFIKSGEPSAFFDMPDEEINEFFDGIKKELDKNGLSVGQIHSPYPTLVVGESKERNEYLLSIQKKCIEIAARMGCKYIVIHPVFAGYENALSAEEERKINIAFYSSIIPTLKKHNVVACLENMWVRNKDKIFGAICSDPNEAAGYIDELNEIAGQECFGFCFDSGHATLCSMDIVKGVNKLGKRIKCLHLHDVDGKNDSHTTPYLGVSDFEKILKSLKSIGYEGTINFEASRSWEQFPKEVFPQAINLLGAVAKHLAEKYFV